MNILAVEDDEAILSVLEEFLQWRTHHVETAVNGQEGLDKFLTAPGMFDVILSDVNMPLLDGIQMMEIIRQQKFLTPAIFITASNITLCAKERDVLQPFAWLEKPFDLEQLESLAHDFAQSRFHKHADVHHRMPPVVPSLSTERRSSPDIQLLSSH